jgi:hypothetical protein
MTGNELGEILFDLVETAQGYAFISDGIEEVNWTPEQIYSLAKISRDWNKETLRILNKFLKDYKEYEEK